MKNKKNYIYISILVAIALGIVIINNNGKEIFSLKGNREKQNFSEITNTTKNEDKEIILEVSLDASYKTGDIEELYKDSSVVVIADYIGDEKTIIEKNNTPFTLSKFKVKKIIKNGTTTKIGNEVTAKKMGGVITVQQLLDARDPAFAEKIGINKLSKEERKSKYVKFFSNANLGDKDLEKHKTRLLFLNYDKENECFVIVQDDYGMLSYNEDTNTAFDITNQSYKQYSFLK